MSQLHGNGFTPSGNCALVHSFTAGAAADGVARPSSPGGSSDSSARLYSASLSELSSDTSAHLLEVPSSSHAVHVDETLKGVLLPAPLVADVPAAPLPLVDGAHQPADL